MKKKIIQTSRKREDIKIATLYISKYVDNFKAQTMDTIRWLKISESLAELGYKVDMITNEESQKIIKISGNLRRLPYSKFNWKGYSVIKTLFQEGFHSLEKTGGQNHPFIISKTTVVGRHNNPSVHFTGWTRWRLSSIQRRMNNKAKYITVLTKESAMLWSKEYGQRKILIVPTGVDKNIPEKGRNPYKFKEKVVLFTGNIRNYQQRKVNARWQEILNTIGKHLSKENIKLCFIGTGDTKKLNKSYVTCLGSIENKIIWDYLRYANCGIALAEGSPQNFESSKIYYYLRAGLPVVCEDPIPNKEIVKKAKLGFIAPYNNNAKMAKLIIKAINKKWDKKQAINYIIRNHTWDKRVKIYDEIFKKSFKIR